jgi:hypothetical protein
MGYDKVHFVYPKKKPRNHRHHVNPTVTRQPGGTNSEKIAEMQLFIEGILEGKPLDFENRFIAEHALLFLKFRQKETNLDMLEKHEKKCKESGIAETEIVAVRHIVLQMEERKGLVSLKKELRRAIRKCNAN